MRKSLKRWILIVEDDKDIREMLRSHIEMSFDGDVGVVEASDGRDASEKLQAREFSCILTDLNMPGISGRDFILNRSKSGNNRETPIIVISGDTQNIPPAPQISILEKPFRFDKLNSLLDIHINSWKPS